MSSLRFPHTRGDEALSRANTDPPEGFRTFGRFESFDPFSLIVDRLSVLKSGELERKRNGEKVRVAGLVVVTQRPPTAKAFVFITMEDKEGLMNIIVRPDVYQQYYKVLRNSFLLIAEGTIQKQPGIPNMLAAGAVGI